MNDNAISKAIVQIHFIIVAAILFCFVVISTLYLSLCSGIHLTALKIGPVFAQELYLKWDERLFASIGTLTLNPQKNASAYDIEKLHDRIAALISHADDDWIGQFDIRHFVLHDANLSVHYNPRKQSRLTWNSNSTAFVITLSPVSSHRTIVLQSRGKSSDFNATFHAQGVLKLRTAELYAAVDLLVANDIELETGFFAGKRSVVFSAASPKPFENVAPLIKPLHLSKETEPWILDRAKGGPVMLHALHTVIPYNDPAKALDYLKAHATFYNARYRFANDQNAFEPVVSDHVTLLFEEKKLNIIPVNATFYNQHSDSTWLNIDFGTLHPQLNLYLDLSARLTPPIHRLISSYGIHLPFIQTEGLTHTWMALNVDLETSKTKANGTFRIDNGKISFNDLPIAIDQAEIEIADSDVAINALHASLFDGNITADISGKFNPVHEAGVLNFAVDKALFGSSENSITLNMHTAPLQFQYVMHSGRDTLHFNASNWVSNNHPIHVDAFSAPFDFGDLNVTLSDVLVTIDPFMSADVSGVIALLAPSADIIVKLDRLAFGSFQNAKTTNRFRLLADRDKLTIASEGNTSWVSGKTNISTGQITLDGIPEHLKLSPVPITIEGQLTGSLDGIFDSVTRSAELNVSSFRFYDDSLRELFSSSDAFGVYIVPIENEFDIIVPDLNMLYSTQEQGWKLHFFSLMAFSDRSALLNEYNLTQSSLTVWSSDGNFPINFKGAVKYPYALTIQDNEPVSTYGFNGRFESNNTVDFTVNQAINVHYADHIDIRSNAVAFNLSEAIRFYKDHRVVTDTNSSERKEAIMIDANNTALVLSDGRSAKADAIKVQYQDDEIYAQLYKAKGGAMLEVKNDGFYLYGNDLDDDFMEHFFNLSRFRGGTLDFYIVGNKNDFNGLIKIDNTTIYDYVLLNNLFAFINTVPALVTFSLPSYATRGIKVKSAYAELKYHEGNLTVSGLKVDSKEMDFAGQGLIDYNKGTMKMQLSVKTQAGDNIRKIPLVGYILVGDDQSVLTTVDVTGPIDDPKISSTIAKDIIIAPFNILKRTLDFPIHYLEKIDTEATPSAKKKKNPHQITSGTPTYK